MNLFVFSNQNSDGTTNLYASDGTAAGTVDLGLSGLQISAFNAAFTQFDGKLLFLGSGPQDPGGEMVYATNGTADGTTASLVSGAGGLADPSGLWTLGRTLLTSGTTQTGGPGIWASSDGTSFKEIETGTGGSGFVTSHGVDYFAGLKGNDETVTAGLWRTDGTAAGTYAISQTLNPDSIAPLGNGRTLFSNVLADGTMTLWTTDGTAAGTMPLEVPGLDASVMKRGLTAFGGRVVFSTHVTTHHDVWITDGTVAGTTKIYANDGQTVRDSIDFTPWGSKLLFTNGYTLLATDGTQAGTYVIPNSYPVQSFVALGSQIVFIAADRSSSSSTDGGFAVFFSDGTAAGTHQLSTGIDVQNSQLVVSGSQVVFSAIDTSGRQSLFSTNGTIAGTTELSLPANVTPAPDNSSLIAALPAPTSSGSTGITLLGQSMAGPLSFKVVDNSSSGKTVLQLDVDKATGSRSTLREFIDKKYVGTLRDYLADGVTVITNVPLSAGPHTIKLTLDGSTVTATASFNVPTLSKAAASVSGHSMADFTNTAGLGTALSTTTASGGGASILPDVAGGTAAHLLGPIVSSSATVALLRHSAHAT